VTQPHEWIMTDRQPWVVKFPNNPSGLRNLPNELIAGRLGRRLGVRIPTSDIVVVSQELIDAQGLRFRNGQVPQGGLCFGSQTVAGIDAISVLGGSPASFIQEDVAAIAVFQTWTADGDGQAIFRPMAEGIAVYSIDHGHFFGSPDWDASIADRQDPVAYTLHLRHFVPPIRDFRFYERALGQLEQLTLEDLAEEMRDVPKEWVGLRERAALITFLRKRQGQVRMATDRFIQGAA
jgi:hypothetical protein